MIEIILNILYTIMSIIVSLLFWIYNSNKGWKRLVASIHSIMLLATLIITMYCGLELKMYNTNFLTLTFYVMLLLSLLSIAFSVEYFRGSNWFHLLHIWNVFAFCLTFFIGGMSITNDWL
jgi:hypothetical protein